MTLFSRDDLDAAARLVHAVMPPTPAYAWPLLAERFGLQVVVKHENHTPIGAFKVRGGIVYLDRLKRERPEVKGIVSATRGNHGQSLAFAARHAGLPLAVVVPHGNSVEKNAAMRAFGAELIEHGRDFDEARERAAAIAAERGFEFVPSFHRDLVMGVATYGLELFLAHPDIDILYAPIGLGSGLCGLISARDLLGLKTRIVGVVSEDAAAYALSVEAGRVVEVNATNTFADGIAVRIPSAEALAIIIDGAERIVKVSEDAIAEAVRTYWTDTHNAAEGAGAAALAALAKEAPALKGLKAAVILSGQNIDRPVMLEILSGRTPKAM
ncbi:threonine dehydratase [Phreatobacter stygius]|uniref:Threonine dehydratase n=1 Tax=Phreatobacter stygius TaxID=1940610 RepID=A0A4D7BB47_9HYPH|nr:threonine dehydratase [Phreatobacter stygius]QCI65332.1 threonine dehydratase [Phreatobacter stygius]